MPIYEYACEHCGHHAEIMQRISEEPLKQCPQCKKDSFIRLVSAAGFRLKGGGWYETDFKNNDKKRNLASGDNANESSPSNTSSIPRKESGAAESKTDSKSNTESSTNSSTNSIPTHSTPAPKNSGGSSEGSNSGSTIS